MTSPLSLLKSVINPSRGAASAPDARGRRFIAVIDCILNQNARDAGAARFPGCAVHQGNTGLATNSGVFMKELQVELDGRNLKVTFKGIRDHDPELLAQDLRWFRELLTRTPRQEPHP